ncbi:hypothetical protein [Pseudomonas koreensis]|uniref:Uncharacterized protein n=1 Tax=Pseudomonas koreensis TaxID=198620 RepID=A0A9X2XEY3_9PSED|nr:hypothetical protein [Pseudomonas koreensis]MCU7247438.1 hypothetical protein [Pseudomonas koreensis]
MKKFTSRNSEYFSTLENEVYRALQHLPPLFRVSHNTNPVQHVGGHSGEPFSYRPDFEVRDDHDYRLLIELKSEHAMSLQNMVKLKEIDNTIRHKQKSALLILVWTRDISRARYSSMPEFEALNIVPFQYSSDIESIIINAFDNFFR